ncbi:FHA domain-containing protein [Desulfonatronum thiodismutans]|uniref:FHA domain-containing protein n=1 Tax=Desulfonatronum thiodismutans TaxID=159290 RepID=UPI0004ABE572|nr:FHA domain-containing protein [Desulfonatronum thiodismutans]
MLQLTITKDDTHVETKVLTPGVYSLGRLDGNEVILDDRQVSRNHAKMIVSDQSVKLEDLGSANKIFVDDVQVDQVELRPGQSAQIRPFTLTLSALPGDDDRTMVMGADTARPPDDATMIMAAPSTAPKMKLAVTRGQDVGLEFSLVPGILVVGRADDCGAQLTDPMVSRRHAEFEVGAAEVSVRDLGSTVGTFVNEVRVQEHRLHPGDIVTLGGTVLELQSDAVPVSVKNIPPLSQKIGARPIVKAKRRGRGKAIALGVIAIILLIGVGWFFLDDSSEAPQRIAVEAEQEARTTEMDQVQRLAAMNLVRGKQALESEMLQEAVDFLQRVVIAVPDHEEGMSLLSQARERLDAHLAEQQRKAQEQMALEQKIEALLVEARRALGANDHARAIREARQLLELDGDHEESKDILGKAEAAQRDEQRRRQQAQAAAQKLESDAKSAFERGQALRQQGKLVDAVRAWEQLPSIDSGRRTRYPAEAEVLIRQVKEELRGRSTPMVEAASRQVASAPRQAYDALQAALRVDPWNTNASELVSDVQRTLVGEARKKFDEGLVLESLGDLRQACERWREALDWVPASDELHQRIKTKEAQCR